MDQRLRYDAPERLWVSRGRRRRAPFLSIVFVVMLFPCALSAQPAPYANKSIEFDVPAQPLMSALKSYGTIAGIELFYESSVIAGLRSKEVRGAYPPDLALNILLGGSGLHSESFAAGTATILPQPKQAGRAALKAIKSKSETFVPYFALIQSSLRGMFCRTSGMQTHPAELLVRLWIAPSGLVVRTELVSSTGSEERDRSYASALRNFVIAAPPPLNMPQPVTLMILPQNTVLAADCAASSNPARASVHE
ncbi:TonB C-terminal domain-containing protein [Bradyrhizobium sp. LHD-71]|uniref:TonB C-terminal domain-containing protein n=1 Tax=Bradyrhizobium sp. LHD-71 TaxID=3072141 RepID=UPI00280FB745|nr:TonB C-terminal domain-containing protein [Bradyrhizobium sp. LHD-71]MDQ8728081.1 TonB C-terminal domain-containing protein [Bradyrhizobium sp. LHD-71]